MEKTRLGELGKIITGKTPSKKNSKFYLSKDICFFKPSDIKEDSIQLLSNSEEYISEMARNNARILPKETILVTCIGTIGKIGILKQEASCNQQINAIIPNEKVYAKYLAYLIYNKREYLQKKANAPVVPIINKTDFSNIEVKICNRKEQIAIANKLDKVQEIIELKNKQISDLDELVKSQFVEMFGDVKKNDKNWKYTTLGKECFFNPKKRELQNINENFEVSFVAMPSVSENGNIDTGIIKKYDDVKKGFTYFAENDVLFAKITPCMENGKGALAVGLKNKIGFGSTEFHVLRPKENINSVWLYTLTAMKSFRIEAERKMTGSAGQKRVPISFFETYNLGLPPIDLQNKFAEIVKQIDKQKFEIQKSLKKMEELKESLMNKYFE